MENSAEAARAPSGVWALQGALAGQARAAGTLGLEQFACVNVVRGALAAGLRWASLD